METHNYILASFFCAIASIKYIIFGSRKQFNDIIFNYIQFIVFTNYLHFSVNKTINVVSDITLWALFGLSPHPNADGSISYLYEMFYNKQNTHKRLLKQDNTTDTFTEELSNIVKWFDTNKFLITIVVIFGILSVTFILGWLIQFINTHMKCKKNKLNSKEVVVINDGSVYNIGTNYWNSTYFSFLIRIILISYCNLSTITIAQLLDIDESTFPISFMAIVVLVFVIIGFPIYIINMLYNNRQQLYSSQCMNKYGPLYLNFKSDAKHNKFMVIIILKQLLYALAINIHSELTIIQNTAFLSINVIFIIFLMIYKPYAKNLYQLQAVLLSIATITITIVNYAIISDNIDNNINYIFNIINSIIHVCTFVAFIIIQISGFIKERKKPKLHTTRIQNDGIKLVQMNTVSTIRKNESNTSLSSMNSGSTTNPIDYVRDTEYQKKKSKRFAHEISENLNNVY